MSETVQLDAPTLCGLEVFTSGSGRDGSLLSVLDRTVFAVGARLLARQLTAPLTSPEQIGRWLGMVRFLVAKAQVRADCREDPRRHAGHAARLWPLVAGQGRPTRPRGRPQRA